MIKRISVLLLLTLVIALLGGQMSCSKSRTQKPNNDAPPAKGTFAQEIAAYGKPVMVDFGLKTCVPCKMMIPVMEELKTKYSNDLVTLFIQVQEEQEKTKEFGIKTIPTQIFFDATGKQIDQHVGFISTQDILATFEKYGITITK